LGDFHYAAPSVGAKSGRNKRGGGAKKPAAQKSGRGRGGSKGAQRFGLVFFGIVFIALFVIFAVAQGLGKKGVPSGDIALVTNVPSEIGHISQADYKTSLAQQLAQSGQKKPPKAGSKKAEELHKTAVAELLNKAWIFGEAEELGIELTKKEVETEIAKVKKESFKTEKAFQEFLKEDHFTEEEVQERIELTLISTKIQEKITKEAPPVTEEAAKEYYEANKATQYTKKPSRDVRVIVNENKKEVEEAQKALEADNSAKSWKAVTKKYSPTTEANGGLQKEISEEFLTEPLKKDIFGAATGELIGPVKQEKSYLLLEVVTLHPEKVQPFAEVKSTITTQLTEEKSSKYFTEWVAVNFQQKWSQRTTCASGYQIESCGNYPASERLAKSREQFKSCYEAEPKNPPKECPAPVTQTKPAVPGTISLSNPTGEQKIQRPREDCDAREGESKAEEKALAKACNPEAEAEAEAAAGAAGGEGSSAEEEAAVKAAEEAAAKAAAEGESGESAKSGKSSEAEKSTEK
jgi:parvulin-like peptidyl-prolyl isomerase